MKPAPTPTMLEAFQVIKQVDTRQFSAEQRRTAETAAAAAHDDQERGDLLADLLRRRGPLAAQLADLDAQIIGHTDALLRSRAAAAGDPYPDDAPVIGTPL